MFVYRAVSLDKGCLRSFVGGSLKKKQKDPLPLLSFSTVFGEEMIKLVEGSCNIVAGLAFVFLALSCLVVMLM